MERRYAREPRRGGGRGLAWLALFFSLAAFAMSGTTLLLTWHDGQLLRDAQTMLENLKKKLPAKTAAEAAPEAAPAEPDAASDNAARWASVQEKLQSAEKMVRGKQAGAREYLDGLLADMDSLRTGAAEKGGQWMDDAAVKVKSIRDQVAVNGPAAARRLRELSIEIRQNIETVRRVSDALRTPAAAAETPAPTPEEAAP